MTTSTFCESGYSGVDLGQGRQREVAHRGPAGVDDLVSDLRPAGRARDHVVLPDRIALVTEAKLPFALDDQEHLFFPVMVVKRTLMGACAALVPAPAMSLARSWAGARSQVRPASLGFARAIADALILPRAGRVSVRRRAFRESERRLTYLA